MEPPMDLGADGAITTSTRSDKELASRLATWLGGVLGGDPVVSDVSRPEGNGMSSETILLTITTTEADGPVERRCVARLEPEMDKCPVFPRYDLRTQFEVMRTVERFTDAPVPPTLWFEPDPTVVGAPFLVMGRVDGQVPPDVMPYTFGDCWFTDLAPQQQSELQRSAVSAVAAIHQVTPDTHDLGFLTSAELLRPISGDSALERHLDWWDQYREWVTAEVPSPLLDECFSWLRSTMPDTEEVSLSWGDARIGNMLFDGTEVTAVLDWEMAGLAPPEVDLGWLTYMHRFFHDLTVDMGMPGLPDLLRPDEVAASYEDLTGRAPADLKWFMAYSAMRHGVIMRRVTERAVLFGEAARPDDPDEMVMHRNTLRAMLDDTYWDRHP